MNLSYYTINMFSEMIQSSLLMAGFELIPAAIITLVALRHREKRSGYSYVATGVFFLSTLLIVGTLFIQLNTFIERSRAQKEPSCNIEQHVKDSITVEVGKTYDIHYFVNNEAITDFRVLELDYDYQKDWFTINNLNKVKIISIPEGNQATFPIQYRCEAHPETTTEWVTINFR